MSCESLAADWKIFLRRTKNHSAEKTIFFSADFGDGLRLSAENLLENEVRTSF